jgi:hypothetical protein
LIDAKNAYLIYSSEITGLKNRSMNKKGKT